MTTTTKPNQRRRATVREYSSYGPEFDRIARQLVRKYGFVVVGTFRPIYTVGDQITALFGCEIKTKWKVVAKSTAAAYIHQLRRIAEMRPKWPMPTSKRHFTEKCYSGNAFYLVKPVRRSAQ